MSIEIDSGEEVERSRWRAHRATDITFHQGVFDLHTATNRTERDLVEAVRRGASDPEKASAEVPRWEWREYEPLNQRNLPNALARIATAVEPNSEKNRSRKREIAKRLRDEGRRRDDAEWLAEREAGQVAERAAIREIEHFYRHYGALGFQELRLERIRPEYGTWPEHGEPLGWIIAEATTVSFALALIDALRRADERDLKSALASRRPALEPKSELEEPAQTQRDLLRYAICRDVWRHGQYHDSSQEAWPRSDAGWYDSAHYPLRGRDKAALMDHAGALLADVIGCHLPGQKYRLLWRDGRFLQMPERGPLLRAIWLHVKDSAIERAEVRRCRECGSPFLVTDRRQQFCPPSEAGGKSRCLARQQMRRLRREGPKPQQGEKEQP